MFALTRRSVAVIQLAPPAAGTAGDLAPGAACTIAVFADEVDEAGGAASGTGSHCFGRVLCGGEWFELGGGDVWRGVVLRAGGEFLLFI